MPSNARSFSRAVAGALCLGVITTWAVPLDVEAQGRSARGGTAGQRHILSLDGREMLVRSAEGGRIVGQVVAEPGRDGFAAKRVAGVRYEPLIVEATIGDALLTDWIADAWSRKARPRNVAVLTADLNYKVTSGLELSNSVIAETKLPTLDAASKEAGRITVVIAPEAIRTLPGTGASIATAANAKQKTWLLSNFRLELGDLPTERVARIDSFTVRTSSLATSTPTRATRAAAESPQFPDLTVLLASTDAKPWTDWHEEFVVRGRNGNDQEKSGAIVLLTPNLKDEIARIGLSNCGIISAAPAPTGSMPQPARTVVQLYCERMQFVPAKQ